MTLYVFTTRDGLTTRHSLTFTEMSLSVCHLFYTDLLLEFIYTYIEWLKFSERFLEIV